MRLAAGWTSSASSLAAGQRFVEVVRTRPGQGGDDGGRGPRPRSRLHQVPQRVNGEADVFVVLAGGRWADDEDDLAFGVAAEAAGQFGEGAAGYLLVHLG